VSSEELKKIKRQRIISSLIILLLSTLIAVFSINTATETGEKIGYTLAGVSTILAAFAALSLYRTLKIKIPESKIYTIVKCTACGYETKRPYKNGDYVHKKEGKCPTCGKQTIIDAIYQEITFK